MKKSNLLFFAAIVAIMTLSSFMWMSATEWKIKEGYSIKFTSDNPTGVFNSLEGTILFDENNLPDSKFDMRINAASINTGNGMKNKHAKDDRFFDVEKYPTITFKSTAITKSASGYTAVGKLKIKETEKEISIPFTFTNNTFSGSFMINRLDYGVGPSGGMAGKASKQLKVDISVPVTK